MKIGVVSDTHSREIPKQFLNDLKKVDFIIHAGDFCAVEDFEQLKSLKDLKAVHGNMDEEGLKKMLPRRLIFQCGSFLIGIFHGEGPRQRVLDAVKAEFKKEKIDCVVFGHSHQPFNEKIEGVLYFNPGSPNDEVCAPYCSYGILEIKDNQITANIIKVRE